MTIEKDYLELRDMASKFADKEVGPLAAQIDHESSIPQNLIKKLKEMGFLKNGTIICRIFCKRVSVIK